MDGRMTSDKFKRICKDNLSVYLRNNHNICFEGHIELAKLYQYSGSVGSLLNLETSKHKTAAIATCLQYYDDNLLSILNSY